MGFDHGKKIQELDSRLRELEVRMCKIEGKPDGFALLGNKPVDVEPHMPQHPMGNLELPLPSVDTQYIDIQEQIAKGRKKFVKDEFDDHPAWD